MTARTCTPYPQGNAGLTGGKTVIDTYDGWGAHGGGQVYCLHLHAAKTVLKSELSKRCLVHRLTVKDLTWLLFDDSSDIWLQLGRDNAACGRIHQMFKPGHYSIDDDDEELGDDDDLKFKMRGRRWKRLQGGSHAEFIEFSGFLRHCTSFTRCSAQGAAAQLAL